MQPLVQRQLDIFASKAFLPVKFPHHAAKGVDLDPLGASRSAQGVFQLVFHTGFADLEFWNLQQRVLIFDLGQVVVANGAHVANDVTHICAVRVMAGQADLGADAGQGGGVDVDLGDVFPAQAVGDGDRHEGRQLAHVFLGACDVGGVNVDDGLQTGQHSVHVACVFAHHDDAVVLFIRGQRNAV